MRTTERRTEIMRILCRRRHETISNLAEEFGVSERTILRDIETLSITEPIYTQCGRYGGGIYVSEDYYMNQMYMSDKELTVLHKILSLARNKDICDLKKEEYEVLSTIILEYTKPSYIKEKKNETKRKRSI